MRKRITTQNESLINEPLFEEYYSSDKYKTGAHKVPWSVGIIFIFVAFALFGLVYIQEGRLPTPLTLQDDKNNPDSFITDRAKHDLKLLTSLGSRVTGSYENEALAVSFFQRELAFIQQQAHRNQKIEVDVQKVSGAFFMDFQPHGAISTYSQIQNIVVKLHGRNGDAQQSSSLLLNSHFDTVPTSPGGTDDGINCVAMLEILRKISRSPYRLRHNVIFLFNGAEETGLRGAHGFITKHKWAKEIKTLINLEGAGAGGKEVLFQTGIPWMIDYYKYVPHPKGQVLSEEIFQSGQIPSDTDFRIFRDYGNVSGMDFAFAENGYRYHTKYDNFENIPNGSYQHVGDNILMLTKLIGNATEMGDSQKSAHKTVFFDFFGFFIVYDENQATFINTSVSLLSFVVTLWSFRKYGLGFTHQSAVHVGLTAVSFVAGWILSGIFVFGTAFVLDLFKSALSWYGTQWLLLGLYTVPSIACCCVSNIMLNNYNEKMNLNVNVQSLIQIYVVNLLWTSLILVGTFLKIRSVYLIMLPVLFQTASCLVVQLLQLQHSVKTWQLVYVMTLVIPTVFLMQVFGLSARILIPMCGRIGPERNPELIMGTFTLLTTVLLSSFYVPLMTLIYKPWNVVKILFVVFIIFFISALTPITFPYSGNSESPTPQRYWTFHTSRTFRNDTNHVHKRNAGFFVMNWDRNAPHSVQNLVKDFKNAKPITDDCDTNLLCGLPLMSSRVISIIQDSTWIPAGQPIVHEQINFKMLAKTRISPTVMQFNFSVAGPSRMHIAISPRSNATLIKTNLVPEIPKPLIWNKRSIYLILHTWGLEMDPLFISLNFQLSPEWKGPTFDISISGKCIHDRTNLKTPQYVQFLNSFPKWADVVPHLATYETWVY